MSAALARRDEGCASDLLMDRWLLGEIPGSDEARRLEQHVRGCGSCEARLLALRSLYGTRPPAKADRIERPRLVSPPPKGEARTSGVLQVVILRDGLLVGTEVFTPGRYEIGRGNALRLEELEAGHAVLHLGGDRVAIESLRGPVFVNGYRVACCELRPIDEVAVGRYVLRTRLISRDEEPQPQPQTQPPAPLAAALALKLELYWGDALQAVQVFTQPPPHLDAWGLHCVTPCDGGFELDGGVRVRHGDSARIPFGPLMIVASTVPAAQRVERTSAREWPWTVIGLASVLAVGLVLFSVMAPVPEEAPFVPKEFKAIAQFIPPPPPKKILDRPVTHEKKTLPRSQPHHPPFVDTAPLHFRSSINNVLKSLDGLGRIGPHKGKGKGLASAGLGLPSLGSGHELSMGQFDTGIGGVGIGSAGAMSHGTIGRGSPLARVTSAGRVHTNNDAWIDRDAVEKEIQKHVSEISACYEHAMVTSGSFAGKMQVEWAIDSVGHVSSSRIKSTDIKNTGFGACVLTALGGWHFPPAHGRVVVSYPFHLNSVGY
jgi:hypothetical protein